MAETVRIVIPPEVAVFVRPETPRDDRLRGATGGVLLPPRQTILLLFCLSKDSDPEVRSRALTTLASLPDERFAALAGWHDLHPALLHTVAQVAGQRPAVRTLLYAHPCLADATRSLLESHGAAPDQADTSATSEEEDGEEYASKYQQAQAMGIAEKIKMALTGDKEWRKILVKDSNKLVSSGVLKNPRLTEPEVLTILKSSIQNDEIIRIICANKEWVKNYQIRKALLENPKTPLSNALRFLGTMNEKDIAGYAKSRNISSVISTQAKRMLLAKQK
ncbi:hypothetical protein [Trichlorobacter ammonificans]|uniref:Leucine rich repeat variant n=1 Tax=Trichlorobacter ammonificans TaxID=2916410 RepID=A0ABM9D7B7_9BACT|nr:hypothetical protein [Trichlorobacter ammonificans]CAH2030374.1 conserved protein of unknown function [Trichlorobacter ammonificans]